MTKSGRGLPLAQASTLPLAARPTRALYLHLPFCARRCPYCDFSVAPLDVAGERRYLTALEREAAARIPAGFSPRTIYLGGGTPAELTQAGLERLGALLAAHVRGRPREVTLEANPRTLLRRKLQTAIRQLGVDRLSLGAQSHDPDLLARLGRFHRPADTAQAVALARELGLRSLSLDLIFAVPGQTLEQLEADLEATLALAPDHVSLYCLTVEPDTAYDEQRLRGDLVEHSSNAQARMYGFLRRRLRQAGFVHYEISSFARPGHFARHNRVYWRNQPYLGLGVSAASHLEGVRLTNERGLEGYLRRIEAGELAVAEREELSPLAKVAETAYLALRTSAGLVPERFLRDTGVDPREQFAEELERLEALGLVLRTPQRIRLSGRGVGLADAIAREFV